MTDIRHYAKAILLVVCAMLCACGNSGEGDRQPSAETVREIVGEIDGMRNSLPVDAGGGMLMTDISYNNATNTIDYKYKYTMPKSVPTEKQLQEMKQEALDMIQTREKYKSYLQQGISFHFEYLSMDGSPLYSVDITPEDLE